MDRGSSCGVHHDRRNSGSGVIASRIGPSGSISIESNLSKDESGDVFPTSPNRDVIAALMGGTASGSVSPSTLISLGKSSRVTPLPGGTHDKGTGSQAFRDVGKIEVLERSGSDVRQVIPTSTPPPAAAASAATSSGVSVSAAVAVPDAALQQQQQTGIAAPSRSSSKRSNVTAVTKESTNGQSGVMELGRRLLGYCGIKVAAQPSNT
jgi:hypothetical protein